MRSAAAGCHAASPRREEPEAQAGREHRAQVGHRIRIHAESCNPLQRPSSKAPPYSRRRAVVFLEEGCPASQRYTTYAVIVNDMVTVNGIDTVGGITQQAKARWIEESAKKFNAVFCILYSVFGGIIPRFLRRDG